ncbi:NUDIX hydrolase [Nakamurella antarctica]|uniref:NUDIX hydrolase n=1 Tax=Nakamurella antarctica TaxID=1902245 RepID=A0A3G8ZRG7_9ACTN|nr:NUDIX hydrolase [Nakamurella antarctica]
MRQVDSKVVYSNDWMTVCEDSIELADGSRSIYSLVVKSDFAVVIAYQDGHFHLVEQYRYAAGMRSWEFPMGNWPAGKGGTPLELAQAELREETGYTAKTWTHLGRIRPVGGYSAQRFDTYLATGLTPGASALEDTESDLITARVSETQFRAMIRSGQICDGPTLAAYALFQLHRELPEEF